MRRPDADKAEDRAATGVTWPAAALPYLLLALAGLCWSGNHVIGRAAAGQAPPFSLGFLRWFVPVLFLTPVAWRHLRRDWPAIRERWLLFAWFGLTGGAIFGAGQYVGLQYTTAVNVSILNSLAPVFIVVAGAVAFRDRFGGLQWFGVACSLMGVMAIVTRGSLQTLTAFQFNAGDLLILFNMAVWAFYSTSLRLGPPVHWLSFVWVLGAVSSLALAPFFLWEQFFGAGFRPTLLTGATVLYVSIFPSVVAFAAWSAGVTAVGSNRSAPMLHLIPLYSVVLAGIFLGERLAWYHVLGFVLIVSGVFLAVRGRQGAAPT